VSLGQDQAFYDAAMRRIYRNILILTVVSAIGAGLWKGAAVGFGVLAGGGGSYLIFYWFHRLAERLGEAHKPGSLTMAASFGFRYLLAGATGYVMMKYLGINMVAMVTGLVILAPAILGEIIYELIFLKS